jgi:hypothetical protein
VRSLLVLFLLPLCACSSTPKVYGPTYDGGSDAAPDAPPVVDSGKDAPDDAPSDAPACVSTLAFLGGNATTAFGAGGPAGSAILAAPIPGSVNDCGTEFGCASPIAIARFDGGLLGVLAQSGGALESTPFASSWADPAPVASAKTIDGPTLAPLSGTAHLVFQDVNYKYVHAEYTQKTWDSASDPVGGSGTSQSFGARGPSAAATGTDLVLVQAGSDSYLYDQTWNASWQPAHKQAGAAVQNTIPPSIIALTGGASELLAAYLRVTDYKVMAVDRKGGTWNATPMLVDVNAFSNDPITLAPLPGGKALLVFRGSDKKPYFSTWDGASAWTAPAPVVAQNDPVILSAPSAAPGVCGADAVVAWAESGGGVKYATFTAGTFSAPQSVGGTGGAKFVAVGTIP